MRAGEEDIFHTRQQHSYKVAQVGRRLAQKCRRENKRLADSFGLDEDVVEAACLAHDLGHPPFGHVGESALDELVVSARDQDGFEGNAQSFRIVCKLSVRFTDCPGLNLTRATLAACLKYPWTRDTKDPKKSKKWSVYVTEKDDFEFAWNCFQSDNKTIEADLMDWADDIAYSVHDLEDFHRCQVIPWVQIIYDDDVRQTIIDRAANAWFGAPSDAKALLNQGYDDLKSLLSGLYWRLLITPYEGLHWQRQQLRNLTSVLVGRYIEKVKLVDSDRRIFVPLDHEVEVRLLKQITKEFVISNPALVAQQNGQRKVINGLFSEIMNSTNPKVPNPPSFLPKRLIYLWDHRERSLPRFAADCIGSLTEREATNLYARLFGSSAGSVLDPIAR